MTVVVLLPGMDGSGEFFQEFVEALGPGVEPLVLAYPSDTPLDYTQLESWVESKLPRGRRYVLLGESFSGPVAISIASKSPRGLCGLILVCTFARCPVRLAAVFAGWASAVLFYRVPIRLATALLLGPFATELLTERLRSVLSRVPNAIWRVRVRAALSVDVTAKLRQISVPVIYLRARSDRVVGSCLGTSAVATIRQQVSSLEVVDFDAPHFLLQTRASEAAQCVREFVSRACR